jgi:uncharacterized protein (DUF2249 family)
MSAVPQPLTLDVRPLIERGIEPFPEILRARNSLRPGQALHVIAPFEPRPLFPLFKADGYLAECRPNPGGGWCAVFTPATATSTQGNELDLRHLEPPQPLQRALEALSRLGRGEELILHTRLRPVHLLETLEPGRFDAEIAERSPGHWVTRLWRITA